MRNAEKVTVLKKTENGKLKSMIVFNSANEQARLYFSDDEKLMRMVIGSETRNLVAFDRVGSEYVADPLTPSEFEGQKGEADSRWSLTGINYPSEFWLDLKGPDGKFASCIDPETNKPTGQARCFVNASSTCIRFQNAARMVPFRGSGIKFMVSAR